MPFAEKKHSANYFGNPGLAGLQMNTGLSKNKTLNSLNYILYLIFLISLIFSSRAVSSITIGVIFLTGIIFSNRVAFLSLFKKNNRNLFLAACILLFLLQVIGLLYTKNTQQELVEVRIKAGLLITPLAVFFSGFSNTEIRKKLFAHYCLVLAVAALYCLTVSFFKYIESNDSSHFFYHALASPISQHAVYFSVLIMIGLIFLFESFRKNDFIITRMFHISLTVFLSIFLLLLSSKFVIIFFLFYLLISFLLFFRKNKWNRASTIGLLFAGLILAGSVLVIRNPVSNRFHEIIKGNIKIITQEKFDQSDYFNGLQFRLLQWRFVAEILNENNHWWIGVSPGDAQDLLNKKYISKNMYTGEKARGDLGYRAYNTHNQFLETLLQNGIIGLTVLLIICFSLLKMAMKNKSNMPGFIMLLLLTWLFSESPFETQYGIVIYTFFPLVTQKLFISPKKTSTV